MPYRTTPLVNTYFYHIFNRGVEKRDIFIAYDDRVRFLKVLFYYQLEGPRPRFSQFNPLIHTNLKTGRIVDIIAYCLMPNHFHLLLRQRQENGISNFLSKVTNSYTKYFNTKYKRLGPLMQGEFKAVLVESNEQLLHLSRYIHLNPFVSGLIDNLKDYIWSSYPDYINTQKNSPVSKEEILNFFSSSSDYEKFVLDHQDYAKTLDEIKHLLLDTPTS